jgi:hypothetical protein
MFESAEYRKNMKDSLKASEKFQEAQKDKISKAKQKKKRCKMCNKIIDKERIYCSRNCMYSDSEYIKKFMSTKQRLKGSYYSVKNNRTYRYRSYYEEKFMSHLDEAVDVVCWEYEPFYIEYQYQKTNRKYIIDFLVTYTDRRKEIIEVGSNYKKVDRVSEKTKSKFVAAKKFCKENGMSFKIITEYNFPAFLDIDYFSMRKNKK